MSEVLDFAHALLSRPSITPKDAGCVDLLSQVLTSVGFSAEIDNTPNGTTNAWFAHGSGSPVLVFAGHVDVVPAGDETLWDSPPFVPTIRDGKLFARGASDMKGSVAAATIAMREFVIQHPDHQGTLAMLITSDEEGDGLEGTKRVIERFERKGFTFDWCIVGEPSCSKTFGDTIKNGRRGSLNGKITIKGKQGHVAYPHLAVNPVHKAAGFISELTSRTWDLGNDYFLPTTFQISNIHAGVGAVNVVPAECEITFNFRFNTCWTADKLIAEVESAAKRHNLECRFEWKCSAQPFVTDPGALTRALKQAVESCCSVTPELNTAGGTSDARFISRISKETVEFGPTNATIHSLNECVEVRELELLKLIYKSCFESLLTQQKRDI